MFAYMIVGLTILASCGSCARLSRTELTLPDDYALTHEQLMIHSDFPVAQRHRLLQELTARRADISRVLALPESNEPIHLYLFDRADRFHAFMRAHYPDFPKRRAFFVETDTRLIVYAHWGDRVAEDLRHEVTHAYLHAVVPNLPLWLDEGLAEYFEVPRGRHGLNRPHLDQLAGDLDHQQWQPDLTRLERFESAFTMTQDDYAESWAWVHFLLHSRPEYRELLLGFLDDLRRIGAADPFSWRLDRRLQEPDKHVIEHIRRLAARELAERAEQTRHMRADGFFVVDTVQPNTTVQNRPSPWLRPRTRKSPVSATRFGPAISAGRTSGRLAAGGCHLRGPS
jgi:hypothetical protein